MGKPAARIGDMHVCPMMTPGVPPIPHVGGPITGPGAPTVLIGGMPASVMGDMCVCVGPPDTIILGSTGVLICGKPAARMGDSCAHGGTIVLGCPTVLIGEAGGGGGGGLGAMPVNVLVDLMGTMPPAVRNMIAQIVAMKQAAETGAGFSQVPPGTPQKPGLTVSNEQVQKAGLNEAKSVNPEKSAFETASEGGKHAGFLKNYAGKPSSELESGIDSFNKEIEMHDNLIKNPAKYMKEYDKGDWETLDPRQQVALVNKKWPSDIKRLSEQRDILIGILNSK